MPLDLSPAVFTPPPIALFESAGRRGIATPLEDVPAPPPSRSRIVRKEHAESSRVTAIETGALDPVGAAVQKAVELSKRQLVNKTQIDDRLRELLVDAVRNLEPFSESSLADLRSLLDSLPYVERPAIFLLDDGNLRAVWRNVDKEQVGLQFRGGGIVQFVMFVRRKQPPIMSRISGTDTLSAIRGLIENNQCGHLFCTS
jgi:hypothetical protein